MLCILAILHNLTTIRRMKPTPNTDLQILPTEILQNAVQSAVWLREVSKLEPEHLSRPEDELVREIQPTRIDWALRLACWQAIRKYAATGTPTTLSDLTAGICHYDYMNKKLRNADWTTWVCLPVRDYQSALEPLLLGAGAIYEQVLRAPIVDADGRLNVSAAKVVLATIARLEDRVYGGVVQRAVNVNRNADPAGPAGAGQGAGGPSRQDRLAELDRKLAELDQREREAQHLPGPQDVEVTAQELIAD